jgi:putative transposase
VQVLKAYKFRAYPTRPQEGRSAGVLRDHCDLYNAAREERAEAWRMQKVGIQCFDQIRQLKAIRSADPEGQGRHSFTAQQQTLRRLDATFVKFYKRAQEGKAGYPRFRSYSRFDQVLFVNGDGAKWEDAIGKWAYARFQAIGHIKVQQHRPVRGRVKTLQLKREGRRWYVIVVTEAEPQPLPATGREVGVDVGIARFLTTSDGETVANPRFRDTGEEAIANLARRKARAKHGSGNRERLRRILAREHRLIRQRRRDFHHKTARALVDSCDVIALEKLNILGMSKRPASKPDGDGGWLHNGAAGAAGLHKALRDAAWAQFMIILTGKAAEAGRRVVFVHPAFTSIDCHVCGKRCTRSQQDTVVCSSCGPWDADINGARNIASRAGLGSGQAPAA